MVGSTVGTVSLLMLSSLHQALEYRVFYTSNLVTVHLHGLLAKGSANDYVPFTRCLCCAPKLMRRY